MLSKKFFVSVSLSFSIFISVFFLPLVEAIYLDVIWPTDWDIRSGNNVETFTSPDCPSGQPIACLSESANEEDEFLYGDDDILTMTIEGSHCKVVADDTYLGSEHKRKVGVVCSDIGRSIYTSNWYERNPGNNLETFYQFCPVGLSSIACLSESANEEDEFLYGDDDILTMTIAGSRLEDNHCKIVADDTYLGSEHKRKVGAVCSDIGREIYWSEWEVSVNDVATFTSPDCPVGLPPIACLSESANEEDEYSYGDDDIVTMKIAGSHCKVTADDTYDTTANSNHKRKVGVVCLTCIPCSASDTGNHCCYNDNKCAGGANSCGPSNCGANLVCNDKNPNSNINYCNKGGQTYFADKCSSSCQAQDRGDNICRSSAFASGCTADPECNGVQAGSDVEGGRCDSTCKYLKDTGLGNPIIDPPPVEDVEFNITCPTNAVAEGDYDSCIKAYAHYDSYECGLTKRYFESGNYIFTCSGRTIGSYTAKCKAVEGDDHCLSAETTLNYQVYKAPDYTISDINVKWNDRWKKFIIYFTIDNLGTGHATSSWGYSYAKLYIDDVPQGDAGVAGEHLVPDLMPNQKMEMCFVSSGAEYDYDYDNDGSGSDEIKVEADVWEDVQESNERNNEHSIILTSAPLMGGSSRKTSQKTTEKEHPSQHSPDYVIEDIFLYGRDIPLQSPYIIAVIIKNQGDDYVPAPPYPGTVKNFLVIDDHEMWCEGKWDYDTGFNPQTHLNGGTSEEFHFDRFYHVCDEEYDGYDVLTVRADWFGDVREENEMNNWRTEVHYCDSGCFGWTELSLPSSVYTSESVTATVSGWDNYGNCNGDGFEIVREGYGVVCTTTSWTCSFTAPGSTGTYKYFARKDMNDDIDYDDPGEKSDSVSLGVKKRSGSGGGAGGGCCLLTPMGIPIFVPLPIIVVTILIILVLIFGVLKILVKKK